ncbi:MAG: hypothetical protein FWE03_04255 [Firmicutes bacterium]|nr:hypothetical protein [Bacillota bacterium]
MEEIVIDKEKRYIAEVSLWETGAALGIKTDYTAVQDWIDEEVFDSLIKNYPKIDGDAGYFEMPTGVKDVTMFADDGNLIADWGDQGYNLKDMRQPMIDFFTKLYNSSKEEIKKTVVEYLDEYYPDRK